jgi:tetratricopeptide (TPR) repeat protein
MPGNTSRRLDDADEAGLKEKYLHSQGAALYDEGRFDEAIDFFERAIALDDQPYTHYHLCLTYIEKKESDKALREINRAIELNPSVAKYYYRRSQIWQSRGDRARADEDHDRAIGLDGNYAHVQRIRSSYGTIEHAFSNVEMLEWCNTVRAKGRELSNVVRELGTSLDEARQALETASCVLPCPAYCCHFSGETIRHGLHIGAWKLSAIRGLLKEMHLPEGDLLGRILFTGEEHLVRLIPPHHVVKERGEPFVYYPKRGEKALGKALLDDLPKGKDYQELLWINEESRACGFLREGKCMIHDLGEEPGLPACKEFLCMTGFVFAVLDHLGVVEASQLRTRSMAELNRLAVKALLILGKTLYDERLTRLRTAGYEALKAAVEADAGDASDEVERCLTKYRRLTEKYDNLFAAQREVAKRKIETLVRTG